MYFHLCLPFITLFFFYCCSASTGVLEDLCSPTMPMQLSYITSRILSSTMRYLDLCSLHQNWINVKEVTICILQNNSSDKDRATNSAAQQASPSLQLLSRQLWKQQQEERHGGNSRYASNFSFTFHPLYYELNQSNICSFTPKWVQPGCLFWETEVGSSRMNSSFLLLLTFRLGTSASRTTG